MTANRYSDIVFLDSDKGREVADRLFNVEGVVAHGMTAESVSEAVAYLSQWDSGDDYEIRDEIPAGSSDAVVFADGGAYVLTANLGLGYVGLSRIVKSEHEHTYSTVYGGEQWCDEHDSAYPCPGSATDQNDDQNAGE